ncbi:hypothetical protein GUITHDRAFT_145930 [Guillardia theta CCMP2712]|uniref:Uncharacterized protein n=1 Tax=Guillardia theta (strain CCMP2712) TaxID=905079 RepID=L1IJ28_GUITC|nr:hypothetical protein GUITHDRAFT_145930 [Guillardia theta CCMP2712]EKX36246.1 hypothetical protein GUITHDRAFT_145930 [Guillardia theta CCMP2712]|eukprot:XP_005823226.1 hypothetical protein GUITHDRAFT_145930 [Guillardia theta CCMP2712]
MSSSTPLSSFLSFFGTGALVSVVPTHHNLPPSFPVDLPPLSCLPSSPSQHGLSVVLMLPESATAELQAADERASGNSSWQLQIGPPYTLEPLEPSEPGAQDEATEQWKELKHNYARSF